MGGLVQQPPHPGAHRRHAAGRSRGTLLRYAGAARHGSMTQTKLPPKNPARFRYAFSLLAERVVACSNQAQTNIVRIDKLSRTLQGCNGGFMTAQKHTSAG